MEIPQDLDGYSPNFEPIFHKSIESEQYDEIFLNLSAKCFICLDPVTNVSRTIDLQEGCVLEYFCELFNTPWVQKLDFCDLKNAEFCPGCRNLVEDAFKILEDRKVLQARLLLLRRTLQDAIVSAYIKSAHSTGQMADLGPSDRLRKLLFQYWTEPKVALPQISVDVDVKHEVEYPDTGSENFDDLTSDSGSFEHENCDDIEVTPESLSFEPQNSDHVVIPVDMQLGPRRRQKRRLKNDVVMPEEIELKPEVEFQELEYESVDDIELTSSSHTFEEQDPLYVPGATRRAKRRAVAKATRKKIAELYSKSSESGQPQCDLCNQTFNHKAKLVMHLKSQHAIAPADQMTCKHCGLNYTTCRVVVNEIEQFHCNCCSKVFPSSGLLRTHHSKKCRTSKLPKFQCDRCPKSYTTLQSLKVHVDSIHDSKFKLVCEVCGKGFNVQSKLKKHVEYAHEKVKKFKCDECDKAFITPHQLKNHQKTHSDRREYVCETCGQAFHYIVLLTKHKEAKHGGKPVPCPQCGKLYASRVHVWSHVSRTHKQLWRRWVANRKARLEAKEQQGGTGEEVTGQAEVEGFDYFETTRADGSDDDEVNCQVEDLGHTQTAEVPVTFECSKLPND